MTERELLRLHLEAGWSLTLPALDPPTQDFLVTQGQPPWSLYLATLAQEQVAIWGLEFEPAQRPLLQAQAGKAGQVWDQTLPMRREVVFHYPLISSQQEAQARQRARALHAGDADLINAFESGSAS